MPPSRFATHLLSFLLLPLSYFSLFFLRDLGFRGRFAPDPIVMLKEHPVAHQVLRQVSAFSTSGATLRAFPIFPHPAFFLPSGSHSDASISDLENSAKPFFFFFLCVWILNGPHYGLNAKAKLRRNSGDN